MLAMLPKAEEVPWCSPTILRPSIFSPAPKSRKDGCQAPAVENRSTDRQDRTWSSSGSRRGFGRDDACFVTDRYAIKCRLHGGGKSSGAGAGSNNSLLTHRRVVFPKGR